MPNVPEATSTNPNPKVLDETGRKPVKSRISNASHAYDLVNDLIERDRTRSSIRAKLKGMLDGNPPYSQDTLKALNRAYQTNVNWREAEAFLDHAKTPYYDLLAEAPTYATVKTAEGKTSSDKTRWSTIITEEFDRMLKSWPDFDTHVQIAQQEMISYGVGPIYWPDPWDWRFDSCRIEDFLIPDGVKITMDNLEFLAIQKTFWPHELWKKVRDRGAAKSQGWNYDEVLRALADADSDKTIYPEAQRAERMQEKYRENDLWESMKNSGQGIDCAYLLVKEFDGKISSHLIRLEKQSDRYLCSKVGWFDDWGQVINPLFYDVGGGQWHGVKGLGIKTYAALEIKNRLMCATVDGAFVGASTLVRPLTAEALQKANVVRVGPLTVLPAGFEVQNQNMGQNIEAPIVTQREIDKILASNTAQYKAQQNLWRKDGTPPSASQVQIEESRDTALNKGAINRHYCQTDRLYTEIYRRASVATRSMPGGKEAADFRDRCKAKGVPEQAIKNVEFVRAYRNIGNGSQFFRNQTTDQLLSIITLLPEEGRNNAIRTWLSSRGGQTAIDLFFPMPKGQLIADDQMAWAMLENAALKDGAPVLVTDTQNQTLHAQVALQAMAQAAASVQQGANPMEILQFLDNGGAHVTDHLNRIAADPSRKPEVKVLGDQLKQLAQFADGLRKKLAQQAQEQAQQQRQAAGPPMPSPDQAKAAATMRDADRKDALAKAKIESTKKRDALKDAEMATKLAAERKANEAQDSGTAKGQDVSGRAPKVAG